MKKVFFLLLCLAALLPILVFAQDRPNLGGQITEQLQTSGRSANVHGSYGPPDPREAIASVIRILLSLLGTIFLVLLIMSGYWLVTARGQEEKIEKAQKTARGAVIGLIIIMASYAITNFVVSQLLPTAT